ncbi:hypothetical protein [Nocardia sp. SC052]|uniref:hypothetical protein n=1 Tax=Nocardia sichangensis TaxID=3385975 RepID=UPI0039A09FF8
MSIHDVIARLRADLDQDEALAQAALDEWHLVDSDPEIAGVLGGKLFAYFERQDPERILRQIELLRKYAGACERSTSAFPDFDGGYDTAMEDVVTDAAFACRPCGHERIVLHSRADIRPMVYRCDDCGECARVPAPLTDAEARAQLGQPQEAAS